MIANDFATIRHFRIEDVTATGADPHDVSLELLARLDRFVGLCKRKVVLLRNGMTTGEHVSVWHRRGLAADVGFCESDGMVDVRHCVMYAAESGFRGIGVYWGGAAYSMHLDCRSVPGQWARWRRHGDHIWRESALITDPREMCR